MRLLQPSDATERYASWLNDTETNKYLETRKATTDDLCRYIKEKIESPNALFFGIFDAKDDKHIGNVKLEPIDREKSFATVGIIIGEAEYRGIGIGTEVINRLAGFVFTELCLAEINLGVIAENKPAIRAYEKCGFVIDHIEPKAMDHDGVLYDKVVMVKKAQ